jgi:peptidyl-prolyl cis-trans isomerase-like 1
MCALLLLCLQGSFTVELYYKHAPRTCHNMSELARSGYYNNTIFHRIIKGFMAQGKLRCW